jgi:hypothetical protein
MAMAASAGSLNLLQLEHFLCQELEMFFVEVSFVTLQFTPAIDKRYASVVDS